MTEMVLSRREQTFIRAVADAYFPPNGPISLSGNDAGIVSYFNEYMRRSEPRTRFLIRLLLAFTELSPFLFGPRFSRFSKMCHADQLTFLDGAYTSRIYFRRSNPTYAKLF